MASQAEKGFVDNFAGAPTVRAEGTAKNLQSFDEISIMKEEPDTASPWVPRGNPRKGLSGDVTDGFQRAADVAPPKRLSAYDDASNLRADNTILTRATPTSQKSDKDKRPNKLRTYQDAAGENL